MKPMTWLSTVDFPAPEVPTSSIIPPGATEMPWFRTAGGQVSSYGQFVWGNSTHHQWGEICLDRRIDVEQRDPRMR